MKPAALQRRTPLRRDTPAAQRFSNQRSSPATRKRRPVSPASNAQRAKAAAEPCVVTGSRADEGYIIDPAHLVPRSLGGCDHPDCTVPLRRDVHEAYDRGELDLLPFLEPMRRAEQAHAVLHLGLEEAHRRTTGNRTEAA